MARSVVLGVCLLAWCATAAGQARDQSDGQASKPAPDAGPAMPDAAPPGVHGRDAPLAVFGSGHLMRGVLLQLNGSHFPGCTLSIPKLDAAGVEGKFNCPQRQPGDLSEIEFSASP